MDHEWQQHVIPAPGAADKLRRLAASYRLGIVSNTHDPAMVPSMLDSMGIADVMSIVLLSVEDGYRKPHPSIYARCLDQLQMSPGEVLFVGDSYTADYDAPPRAGMHALLISDSPLFCRAAGPPLAHGDRHRVRATRSNLTIAE
jgi:putative hydrolase of the HAD superfamily